MNHNNHSDQNNDTNDNNSYRTKSHKKETTVINHIFRVLTRIQIMVILIIILTRILVMTRVILITIRNMTFKIILKRLPVRYRALIIALFGFVRSLSVRGFNPLHRDMLKPTHA